MQFPPHKHEIAATAHRRCNVHRSQSLERPNQRLFRALTLVTAAAGYGKEKHPHKLLVYSHRPPLSMGVPGRGRYPPNATRLT